MHVCMLVSPCVGESIVPAHNIGGGSAVGTALGLSKWQRHHFALETSDKVKPFIGVPVRHPFDRTTEGER